MNVLQSIKKYLKNIGCCIFLLGGALTGCRKENTTLAMNPYVNDKTETNMVPPNMVFNLQGGNAESRSSGRCSCCCFIGIIFLMLLTAMGGFGAGMYLGEQNCYLGINSACVPSSSENSTLTCISSCINKTSSGLL